MSSSSIPEMSYIPFSWCIIKYLCNIFNHTGESLNVCETLSRTPSRLPVRSLLSWRKGSKLKMLTVWNKQCIHFLVFNLLYFFQQGILMSGRKPMEPFWLLLLFFNVMHKFCLFLKRSFGWFFSIWGFNDRLVGLQLLTLDVTVAACLITSLT